jgi:hypothetical protein
LSTWGILILEISLFKIWVMFALIILRFVYVHWIIAKGVQSQALLGIQRDATLHNDGGFEAPKNSQLPL